MREAKLSTRPNFNLMKLDDIVSFYHLQMPRWLFFASKYTSLSLESKVAYTFLLNRFQLSKMNGWVNGESEVFIIYPREKLAEDMGVSYRKAIACFKELVAANLIWEQRIGRGNANHIYMAAVELSGQEAATHDTAPFDSRSAKTVGLDDSPVEKNNDDNQGLSAPVKDMPNEQVKTCKNGTSRHADSALPEVPFSHPSYIDKNYKEKNHTEIVSPSCHGQRTDQAAPKTPTLEEILEVCEFEVLPEHEAGVFRNAVTRLYYCDSYRIGSSVLPQPAIREQLRSVNGLVLFDARDKMRGNATKPIKNTTGYLMTCLMNSIFEIHSDVMVDF